jgi:hypothetical protein
MWSGQTMDLPLAKVDEKTHKITEQMEKIQEKIQGSECTLTSMSSLSWRWSVKHKNFSIK